MNAEPNNEDDNDDLEIKVKSSMEADAWVDFEEAHLDCSQRLLYVEITISGQLTSESSKNKISRFLPILHEKVISGVVSVKLIENSEFARNGNYYYDGMPRSPDCLKLLFHICHCADILSLVVPSLDIHLCTALFAGLANVNLRSGRGMHFLNLDLRESTEYSLEEKQIFLLSVGLAEAKSLQYLRVSSRYAIEGLLVDCLKENKTVRDLFLQTSHENVPIVPRLLGACQSLPILETLHISIPFLDSNAFSSLNDYICSKDCKLRSLTVRGTAFPTEIPKHLMSAGQEATADRRTSPSLQKISIESTTISEEVLRYFCSIATSNLVELHMDENQMGDLVPLEELLLTEGAGLRKLTLSNSQIDSESIMRFALKLPRMLSIESLDLNGNPFLDSKETVDFLLQKVQENRSLGSLNLGHDFDLPGIVKVGFYINAGGRRGIFRSHSKNIPIDSKLLPLILSKAQLASYKKQNFEEIMMSLTNTFYHLLVEYYAETVR